MVRFFSRIFLTFFHFRWWVLLSLSGTLIRITWLRISVDLFLGPLLYRASSGYLNLRNILKIEKNIKRVGLYVNLRSLLLLKIAAMSPKALELRYYSLKLSPCFSRSVPLSFPLLSPSLPEIENMKFSIEIRLGVRYKTERHNDKYQYLMESKKISIICSRIASSLKRIKQFFASEDIIIFVTSKNDDVL